MSKSKKVTSGKFDLLKSANKKRILDVILEYETISKSEIVHKTGFTIPTVTRFTDEFIKDGLVKTIGKGDSTGGRKPTLFSLDLEKHYFLGVSVARKVESVVTNIRGDVLSISQRILQDGLDTEDAMKEIKECMEETLHKSGVPQEKIVYAGIGIPGTGFKNISRKQEMLFRPWVNTNYRELYEIGNFPYPIVFENAVKMGAMGELKFGVGKEIKNFLYIYVDEGIGMGVVTDGVLQVGANHVGGEFGHTTIDYGGPLCYCGNKGCVEVCCAVGALVKEYQREQINCNPELNADTKIEFSEFVQAVDTGDEIAIRVARSIGRIFGIGVGNVINLYNPEAIVFGGEISGRIPLYIHSAVEEAKKHIFINEARKVEFYISKFQDQAENLGAAANAISSFIESYCECGGE